MHAERRGVLGCEFAGETDMLFCCRRDTCPGENSFLPMRLGLSPNLNHFFNHLLMSGVIVKGESYNLYDYITHGPLD